MGGNPLCGATKQKKSEVCWATQHRTVLKYRRGQEFCHLHSQQVLEQGIFCTSQPHHKLESPAWQAITKKLPFNQHRKTHPLVAVQIRRAWQKEDYPSLLGLSFCLGVALLYSCYFWFFWWFQNQSFQACITGSGPAIPQEHSRFSASDWDC